MRDTLRSARVMRSLRGATKRFGSKDSAIVAAGYVEHRLYLGPVLPDRRRSCGDEAAASLAIRCSVAGGDDDLERRAISLEIERAGVEAGEGCCVEERLQIVESELAEVRNKPRVACAVEEERGASGKIGS